MPLGAATVSNDLVFTTLYNGVLIALDRYTGAIVYRTLLPTSTNAPIAIAGRNAHRPSRRDHRQALGSQSQPTGRRLSGSPRLTGDPSARTAGR